MRTGAYINPRATMNERHVAHIESEVAPLVAAMLNRAERRDARGSGAKETSAAERCALFRTGPSPLQGWNGNGQHPKGHPKEGPRHSQKRSSCERQSPPEPWVYNPSLGCPTEMTCIACPAL
eukprot:1186527-Prorocentrum_minimum.AAC.2